MNNPLHSLATCFILIAALAAAAHADAVSTQSLLAEMVDRDAPARWPEPSYITTQSSSHDTASVAPDKPGWFANEDWSHFVRSEKHGARTEWVMLDVTGPGAVVRLWNGGAESRGTMRIYIDGAEDPAVESVTADLLGGAGPLPPPFSQRLAKGENSWFPIAYQKSCKITYDEGTPELPKLRFYNIDYRTYAPGTSVESFTNKTLETLRDVTTKTGKLLVQPEAPAGKPVVLEQSIEAGGKAELQLPAGSAAVRNLELTITAPAATDMTAALRSLVLSASFDGEQTIWSPAGDFFGSGHGLNKLHSWYRDVSPGNPSQGTLVCRWTMPYEKSAALTLSNLGKVDLKVKLSANVGDWFWDARSMHFYSSWHQQQSIAPTPQDWNYVTIHGQGVYLGDTLTVFDPSNTWWGEGDEKIWVDDDKFPSHFGTGSEDYYCYAWGTPEIFQSPFANQVRVGKGPRGYAVETRTRSLDGIPFSKSFKFGIEVYEPNLTYAAATYWYARPGATCDNQPQPDETRAPSKQSDPIMVADAVECEQMPITAHSPGLVTDNQVSALPWSDDGQLFVQSKSVGDFIELQIADHLDGPRQLILRPTKSFDYGTIQFSINGQKVGAPRDLYAASPVVSDPISLGTFAPKDGKLILRAEVTGANPAANGAKYYFGLDCIQVLKP